MKKLILPIFVLFLMVSSVLAVTVTRDIPSSAQANDQFIVTYDVDPEGETNFGITIADDITGGCTWNGNDRIRAGFFPGDDPISVTFTAPSTGSCTFTGDYDVTTQDGHDLVNFPSATVSITGGDCTPKTCSQMGWECDSGTENECSTTISCGGCSSGKECSSHQCVTSAECNTNSDCASDEECTSGNCEKIIECTTNDDCDSDETCVSDKCVAETVEFCPDGETKQFWQSDDCTGLSTIAWGGIIVVGLFAFFMMVNK